MFSRKWQAMPRLIRFMIQHFADGAVMGCLFGLLLIRLDTAGLGTLLETAQSVGPTALFLAQAALSFGTLSIAVGIVSLRDNSD